MHGIQCHVHQGLHKMQIFQWLLMVIIEFYIYCSVHSIYSFINLINIIFAFKLFDKDHNDQLTYIHVVHRKNF